jgi:cell division septum initiation protein DivIVA
MERHITPDEIRGADLGRSIRGYNRTQTEQFLADVAEAQARLITERDALAQEAEALRSEISERDAQAKRDLAALNARFEKSQQRAVELEAELGGLRQTRSREDEKSQRVREELARANAALAEQRSELAEHEEVVVRLRTREKALSEQLRMMEADARARADDLTEQTTAVEEQALVALARVEQTAAEIEREARDEMETILTEARRRADEIIRAAESSTIPEPVRSDDASAPHPGAPDSDLEDDLFRFDKPPELGTPANAGGLSREAVHRPEFDAPASDLSLDLRPGSPELRLEPDEAGGADEDAHLPLSDYRDLGA